jgi:membrane associated rhomboid family serine protease
VNTIAVWLRGLPQVARWGAVGAASVGVLGAIIGLIVGLHVYAPTAPFAAVELGLPATIVGGVLGLVSGMFVAAGRRVLRNHPRTAADTEALRQP